MREERKWDVKSEKWELETAEWDWDLLKFGVPQQKQSAGEAGVFRSTFRKKKSCLPEQWKNVTQQLQTSNTRMDLTSLEDHTCNTKRTRCCAGPGRRRHDRLRSYSDGNKRRTNRPAYAFFANYQARRRLPLLIRAIAFVATVARGGVLASSNPLELNGGSCLAMAGKDCVALAVDRRFGLEGQLVSTEAKRVLKVGGQQCANAASATACRTLSFAILHRRHKSKPEEKVP